MDALNPLEATENKPFQGIAPYYDHLMRGVPYPMWVGYYLLLLATIDSHPRSMLEVGCGTGTLCKLLHEEGFELSGIDISRAMIAEANERHKDLPITFTTSDARTFELNRQFDSIFSFFDSLNNLITASDLELAFQRVYAHLKPGGSFVFDLNTPFAFEEHLFDQRHLNKKSKLRYNWVGTYNPESRIIQVNMEFWWQDRYFQEIHTQRGYEPYEVIPLLQQAGFQEIRAFHSYGLEPPRKSSDRVHFTAIKSR